MTKLTSFIYPLFISLLMFLTSCDLLVGKDKGVRITRCDSLTTIDSTQGEGWKGQILGNMVTLSFNDRSPTRSTLILKHRPGELPVFVSYKIVQSPGVPIVYMDRGSICIQDWDPQGIVSGEIHNPDPVGGAGIFWYDFSPDATGKK